MKIEEEFIVESLEKTNELAKCFASLAYKGLIITLSGDLGAGKTTFAKAFAQQIGVNQIVNSPTFNIVKTYHTCDFAMNHIDCYRLEDKEEDIGLEEIIFSEAVSLIEWPVYLKIKLDKKIDIQIIINGNQRKFIVSSNDEVNIDIIKKVVVLWHNTI